MTYREIVADLNLAWNKQNAAINAAHRHVESGSKAKPFVVPGYEAVYLQEYEVYLREYQLTQEAVRVG